MAEDQDFDKSELPTQRRRDEAREMGQFAYSHELINGLLLFSGTIGLSWIGLTLCQGLSDDFHFQLGRLTRELTIDGVMSRFTAIIGNGMQLTGLFSCGLFAIGLAANIAQAGFHINTESLGPKWERLNPAENWSRIISWEGVTRGGLSIAKVILLAAVSWWVLSGRGAQVGSLAEGMLGRSVSSAWAMTIELLIYTSSLFVVTGAADFGLQWYRNERRLRMSREEVKQEHKDDNGDPHIIAKRRQRAREIAAQRRMIRDVPKATVVITNPTHLAVALRYKRGEDAAPVVIAKGADQMAFQIASKARRHGIPVIERKPVARALFQTVRVGQEIPQSLFIAVSEVLAYIYRLRGSQV